MRPAAVHSGGPLLTPAFIVLWVAAFLQEMSFGLLVHLPGYMAGLGLGESSIGMVYASGAVVALALRPRMGRAIDELGRKHVMIAVSSVYAVVPLAYIPLTRLGPGLVLVHVLYTVSEIFLFTIVLTYATDILPVDRRTQGLALLGISGLLPIGLGSVMGDLVLGAGDDFVRLFTAAAAMATLAAMLVWGLPAVPSTEAVRRRRRGFVAVLRQRDLAPLWLAVLAFAIAMTTLFTYLRTYVDTLGLGSVGAYLAPYSGIAIASRLVMSSRVARLAPLKIEVPAAAALAGQFLVVATVDGVAGLIVAGGIGGLGHGLMFPVLSASVADRTDASERGTAFAIMSGLFDVVVLVVAPIVGLVIEAAGYTTAFLVVAVAIGFGFLLFVVWERRIASPRLTTPA